MTVVDGVFEESYLDLKALVEKTIEDTPVIVPGKSGPRENAPAFFTNFPSSTDAGLNVVRGWTNQVLFSASSSTVVARASGTLTMPNGDTYSISAGNTGTMSAITYIFIDISVSSTVLQVTTNPNNSVGVDKILVAVAQNQTSPKVAVFQVFGTNTQNNFITADNIAANSITANEVAANSITANEMNVSQLSAITADVGTITSGSITGTLIKTSASGQRVELNDGTNTVNFYNSAGTLSGKLEGNAYSGIQAMLLQTTGYIVFDAGYNCIFFDPMLTDFLYPSATNTKDIGSPSLKYRNLYIDGTGFFDAIDMNGGIDMNNFNITEISSAYFYDGGGGTNTRLYVSSSKQLYFFNGTSNILIA